MSRDYSLIILMIIIIVSIAYFWYMSRHLRYFPDDKILNLSGTEDKVISKWYNDNIKNSYDFTVDNSSVAAKFLSVMFNYNVNPTLLIMGNNLDSEYLKLTGNYLDRKGDPLKDSIFEMRPFIAKEGQIAIIYNSDVLRRLRRTNDFDINQLMEINDIINSDSSTSIRDYIQDLLKQRWDKLKELNDPLILNSDGSYLYLRLNPTLNSTLNLNSNNDETIIFKDIEAANTSRGARINLLCSNLEFDTLIKRLKMETVETITN